MLLRPTTSPGHAEPPFLVAGPANGGRPSFAGPGATPEGGSPKAPRPRMSLWARLVLALLLAGVPPVAVHGALSRRDTEEVLRADALDRTQQVAQLLAARVNLFVRASRQHLAVLADSPELAGLVIRGDWPEVQRHLDSAAHHHPEQRATTATDAAGTVRAGTGVGAAFVGDDISQRPSIALARLRGRLSVATPFLSPVDGRPVLAMGAPILDGERIAGFITASVELSDLAAEIQRVRVGATGFAVVQAADGRIIVHRDPSRLMQVAPGGTRAATLTRRGPTGAQETTRPDGTRDITGYATVPDLQWVVLAHIPQDEALAGLAVIRRRMLTLLAWLLAMLSLVALMSARILARPLNELAEAARALGAGDTARRVGVRRNDEVGDVAQAFNEMACRRQQTDAALQVSFARRNALAQLSAGIVAESDRNGIMRQVVTATARLLDAPYAVLWTADPERGLLTVAAEEVAPALRPLPSQRPIPLNRGFASTIMGNGRPVTVADVRNDPRWGNPAWPGLEVLGAYVGVPLAHERLHAGVLAAMDRPGRAFTGDEIELLRTLGTHALLALEKAKLLEAERQAAAETRALYEAGRAVTESLDLDTALARIAEGARHLGGADRSLVWLVSPADGTLKAGIGLGPGAETFLGMHLSADSPAAAPRAVREGRPIVVPNTLDAASPDPALSAQFGNAALLAFPLRVQEAIPAVLVLGYNQPRTFAAAEVNRLAVLAQQAAIAIQNARLHTEAQAQLEAIRRQHAAARALLEVSQAITKTLDLDLVLELIVEKTHAITGADACSISRVTPAGDLEYVQARGFHTVLRPPARLPRGEGVMGRCLEVGAPVWSRDVLADPAVPYDPETRARVQAEDMHGSLAVPILTSEGPYGVLFIGRRRPHDHTREEVAFAEALATQAGIAIENARLYRRERAAVLAAEGQRARAEALAAIAHAMSASLDLDDVLTVLVERAATAAGAHAASVMEQDPASGDLALRKTHGLPPHFWRSVILPRGAGIAGAALASGQPQWTHDIQTDMRYTIPEHIRPLNAEEGIRAIMAVPIRIGDEYFGVLLLYRQDLHTFDAEEIAFASRIADQAAVAIEKARLYQQVASHAETLEARVRERTAELEKANQAKSEFLANMSHELRTPLNAIIGFADLLKMPTFGSLTPKQERYLANIQTGGRHLLALVNDVLDLARVEAGRLTLHLARIGVPQVLADALDELRPQAEDKDLFLRLDLAQDLMPVQADAVRLRQILVNLLSNAVKFTPAGGSVTLRGAAVEADGRGWVEIAVVDTGIGIAPEDMGRLFRKFEQLHGGLAKPYQGTGLGLALTKHLVELHGGTIAARSDGRDRGTTVTVRMPAAPRRPRPAVLVVDGDAAGRERLTEALREWGADAVAAATRDEARIALARALPDLVILDGAALGGQGFEFACEIRRALAPNLPILMFAGAETAEGKVAAAAGVASLVEKDAPLDALQCKVSTLLAQAGWGGVPPA